MTKKVLLTRPRSSSENLAKLLSYSGFESLIEPLLTIEPLGNLRPSGAFQSCMITSASVFEVMGDRKEMVRDLFARPCYCVGEATGEAARRFGFMDIRQGDTDSAALAHNIIADQTGATHILHLSGDIVDGKAEAVLAQHSIRLIPWKIYHARATTNISVETEKAFRAGDISAILLFSPRSAQILVSLLKNNGLAEICSTITIVALSQAVADMVKTVIWRDVRIAAAPTEEEVLTCLGKPS